MSNFEFTNKSLFPDGKYILGTAPTNSSIGKPLYELELKNNTIIDFKPCPFLFKMSAQFIINSGIFCLKQDDTGIHKYWLIPV